MNIKSLVKEVATVTNKIKLKDVRYLVELLNERKRVYVAGEGRSGLVAKSFALRLARLEKMVYVVGETVTPPVKSGDLMIVVSGSGETKTLLETVKICRVMGGEVVSISASPGSALAKISHKVIIIPAQLPKRLGNVYQLRELIGVPERPPLASIFELASLVFLEVVAFRLERIWRKKNKKKRLLPS